VIGGRVAFTSRAKENINLLTYSVLPDEIIKGLWSQRMLCR
jgi:hypothetical protein